MGLDSNQFIGEVEEEFYCSICLMIIEDPIASHCDHIFCKKCINEWLLNSNTCPVDRMPLTDSQLTQSSRYFRKHYSMLVMKCDFESNGCQNCSKIEDFERHKNEFVFNKNPKMRSNKGCDGLIPKTEEQTHDCVQYLKNIHEKQTKELNDRIKKQNQKIKDLKRELIFSIQRRSITLNAERSSSQTQTEDNDPYSIPRLTHQTTGINYRHSRGCVNPCVPSNTTRVEMNSSNGSSNAVNQQIIREFEEAFNEVIDRSIT